MRRSAWTPPHPAPVVALFSLALTLMPAGCRNAPVPPRSGDLDARAERLARGILIVDSHIDVPDRLSRTKQDICLRTGEGDFDYPRARAGGLKVAFMSIFVGSGPSGRNADREQADRLIDLVEGLVASCPDKFTLVRSPAEVRERCRGEAICLPMGLENGAPIGDDLANLDRFFERGIRYVTLGHTENNQICDSSTARERRWHGLSPFGEKVVAEMNRLGLMIDVSHITDEAFDQVIELSAAPVIASHSSCRKFTPGWERNVDDRMIERLAAKGGVIQINFGSMFVVEAANRQATLAFSDFSKYVADHKLGWMDEEAQQYRAAYWKAHPKVYGDVSDVAAHIDHVARLVGVDHVGIGSDFEGVGDSLPAGLKDVSQYPNLIRELLARGYSDEDVRKICGENILRVWSDVERVAREQARRRGVRE